MTGCEEVDFRMCSNHPTEAASVLRLLVTDMIGDWATHKRSFSLLKLYFGSVYTELRALKGHKEYLYGSPLVQIPNPHSLVLTY